MKALRLLSLSALLVVYLYSAGGPLLAEKPDDEKSKKIYYLTQGVFDGDEAFSACAPGYHMASLWELRSFAKLQYDADLGYTPNSLDYRAPEPPFLVSGWIRSSQWDGSWNCDGWTQDTGLFYGGHILTLASPVPFGESSVVLAGDEFPFSRRIGLVECADTIRVWCIED